jgi:hypothetical protein
VNPPKGGLGKPSPDHPYPSDITLLTLSDIIFLILSDITFLTLSDITFLTLSDIIFLTPSDITFLTLTDITFLTLSDITLSNPVCSNLAVPFMSFQTCSSSVGSISGYHTKRSASWNNWLG